MAKRHKEVFGSHANLAHVWAQYPGEYRYGRSSDGRMFFDGATLYSYGRHFAIAQFADLVLRGKRVVLWNDTSRSISTSKHQSHARHALTDVPHILIPVAGLGRDCDLDKTFDSLLESLAFAFTSWPQTREHLEANRVYYSERLAEASKEESESPSPSESWSQYQGVGYYAKQLQETNERLESLPGREAREVCEAFLKLYPACKRRIPRDVVAWYESRKAKAAAKKKAAAERNARDFVQRTARDWQPGLALLEACKSRYDVESKIRLLDSHVSKLYAARNVLGKAKRFPKLVKLASHYIKELKATRAPWEAELARFEANEKRARLEYLVNGAESNGRLPYQISGEESGEALAVALELEKTKAAELLRVELFRERYAIELRDKYGRHALDSSFWRWNARPQVTLEDWRAGLGNASQYGEGFEVTRVRHKADHVETSRGAVAPWRSAVRAFHFAAQCRGDGKAWQRNGHKMPIGPYQLDSIDTSGDVRAGCHTLLWSEMLACALQELTPSEIPAPYPLPVPLSLEDRVNAKIQATAEALRNMATKGVTQ